MHSIWALCHFPSVLCHCREAHCTCSVHADESCKDSVNAECQWTALGKVGLAFENETHLLPKCGYNNNLLDISDLFGCFCYLGGSSGVGDSWVHTLWTPTCAYTYICINKAFPGATWILFLIRLVDLIGVWFGEAHITNITKTHV